MIIKQGMLDGVSWILPLAYLAYTFDRANFQGWFMYVLGFYTYFLF